MSKLKLKQKRRPPLLPASPLEAAAIANAERGYRALAPQLAAKISTADLERMLLELLRTDRLAVVEKAVDAAENERDEIADRCLRQVYREKADAPGGEMSATLRAFGIRAVDRAPVTRGPGAHTWHGDFKRDVLIGMLVQATCIKYGLRKSRSRGSRRDQRPSGASVVAAAVQRCGVDVQERRVEAIHDGLAGLLAEAFSAYFSWC